MAKNYAKFCVDCQHHKGNQCFRWPQRPDEVIGVNMVTGKPDFQRFGRTVHNCIDERQSRVYYDHDGKQMPTCGTAAVFFVPRWRWHVKRFFGRLPTLKE